MMMDPAVKIAMAGCVLLAGVCAATLVRRDSAAQNANTLSIRRNADPPRTGKRKPADCVKTPAAMTPRPVVVTPVKREESPPPMDGTVKQVHKIIDGDSLPALAERYLGDASRAKEIFEANRDVLTDFQLLPIGVELKIPPRNRPPAPSKKIADP
jgi:nucleoid-associated protein YgaU